MVLVKGNARSSGFERAEDDWYCESAASVDGLLAAEPIVGRVWDPACGGGNILRQCRMAGIEASGSDLVDRGAAMMLAVRDFLLPEPWRLGSAGYLNNIITNPPFSLSQEFVERALTQCDGKVIVLQRLAWLEGKARREFFLRTGMSHVWVHSSRISMPPGKSTVPAKGGSVAFAWYVWRRTPPGQPATLGWLP